MDCHLHTRIISPQITLDSLPKALSLAAVASYNSWFCLITHPLAHGRCSQIQTMWFGFQRQNLVTTQKPKKLLKYLPLITLDDRREAKGSVGNMIVCHVAQTAYEFTI